MMKDFRRCYKSFGRNMILLPRLEDDVDSKTLDYIIRFKSAREVVEASAQPGQIPIGLDTCLERDDTYSAIYVYIPHHTTGVEKQETPRVCRSARFRPQIYTIIDI
jgi:hypothetical protein